MAKKARKWKRPKISGQARPGATYLAINAMNTSGSRPTTVALETAAARFRQRFGYDPDEAFYGKPNGSLIYCGPVLDKGQPAADQQQAGQLNLI